MILHLHFKWCICIQIQSGWMGGTQILVWNDFILLSASRMVWNNASAQVALIYFILTVCETAKYTLAREWH